MFINQIATTLIESSMFTLTLFSCIEIKLKKLCIFSYVIAIWKLFILSYNKSKSVSIIINLITNILFIIIDFKRLHFSYISYPLLLYGILLFSKTVAFSIVSYLFEISIVEIHTNQVYLISGIIISRLVFLLSAVLFYILISKSKESTKIKEW